MAGWPRVIVHADMDAFYAAVEQLDAPELRGQPVLVGPNSRRGVVLTASYEARPSGVGSAMPMARARALCPQAIVVPPRFERYKQVSKRVMQVFADFSPRVEALSLDEAFLDMSGTAKVFGDPETIGRRLKAAIAAATGGLTASVGIATSKYVAKVASAYRKPDGLTIVPEDRCRAWLAPLPLGRLWGAGPKLQARLRALGFETIGDIAACDAGRLVAALGPLGRRFHDLARGVDRRPVASSRQAKSIGSERTLERDIRSEREIAVQLRRAADGVGRRLRRKNRLARGVRVKLKRSDFKLLTRQRALAEPTQSSEALYRAAIELLPAFGDPGPFRLVGIAAYDLAEAGELPQLALPMGQSGRERRLEAALDAAAQRFGPGAVYRAGELLPASAMVAERDLDFLHDD